MVAAVAEVVGVVRVAVVVVVAVEGEVQAPPVVHLPLLRPKLLLPRHPPRRKARSVAILGAGLRGPALHCISKKEY